MKLNWGHSIVLVIIGFMTFIMYFVIKGYYVQQVNLVTDDYYDQGLLHDEVNQWKQNARELSEELHIQLLNQEVEIILPNELNKNGLSGSVLFYRPNDSKFDVNSQLKLGENSNMIIPGSSLLKGFYIVKIKAELEGKIYYWEKNFSY